MICLTIPGPARGPLVMFIFGHLGIGSKLAQPWRGRLPLGALLLGTVLPDLIDKPLYYGWVALAGRERAAGSLISGSRTFGHTLILLAVVLLMAYARRSRALLALAVGMMTHHLIDLVGDRVQLSLGLIQLGPGEDGLRALLWPLLGWRFPTATRTLAGHASQFFNPWILAGEAVGLLLLAWDYGKRRARSS